MTEAGRARPEARSAKGVDALTRFNDRLVRFCEWALMAQLALIVAVLFASVVWRYVLRDPLSWSADAALLFLVWMTLLGAPVGMRGGHVAVTGAVDVLPLAAARWMLAAVNAAVAVTALTVVWFGIALARQGMARIVPSIDWLSQGWIYAALPVGFALIVPVAVENVLRALRAKG